MPHEKQVSKGTVSILHGLDTETGVFLDIILILRKRFTLENTFSFNFSLYDTFNA